MPKPRPLSALGALRLLGLAACGADNSSNEMMVDLSVAESTNRAAQLALACSGCLSPDAGAIAFLDGYSANLMEQSLLSYKSGANGTTVMHRLARGYSDADIKLISEYLGHEAAP